MQDKNYITFIKLLFNEGEQVAATPDKYARESVDQLVVSSVNTQLISINPVNGQRCDANVTSYRSFLVEMDDGSLKEQYQYIKDFGLPYSACVFSGGKSLHYAITLEEDLPNERIWRFVAEWILACLPKADQMTKNPSRSIRFPGFMRDGTEQKLLELHGRIPNDRLWQWLNQWPNKKPVHKKKHIERKDSPEISNLPSWAIKVLMEGVPQGKSRNTTWYAIGFEMFSAGFDEDNMVSLLEGYYEEEHDFRYSEWKYAVVNGFRTAEKGNI